MPLYTEDYIQTLESEVLTYQNGLKTRIPDELVDIDQRALEAAVKGMALPAPTTVENDLVRIPVDAKMAHNSITQEANKKIIYASLCYSAEVAEYIKRRAIDVNDKTFPYRLKAYFKGVYALYYNNNFRGDDLFDRVVVTVVNEITSPAYYQATIAIIVHLFEICDLFEKPPHATTDEIHSAS